MTVQLDASSAGEHAREIARGQRFAFGENWRSFLSTLDDERIEAATRELAAMLDRDLNGAVFIDAGSGSGLMSLAARRLGARVISFDYDPDSVGCTATLRDRYMPDDPDWDVYQGSVLDEDFLADLPKADVVYSWGVLHHTGSMWRAIDLVQRKVAEGGSLFIAIYNDQGPWSRYWAAVKRTYCRNAAGKWGMTLLFYPYFAALAVASGIVNYRDPLGTFRWYRRRRGMSLVHDWVDWLGGYPFEVAKPEDLFYFLKERGFALRRLKTTNRLGCNELVFDKSVTPG